MNKRFWLSVLVVFVVMEVLSFFVNGVLLAGAFNSVKVWRPDMMSLMWIYYVMALIGAFFFTFIFSKGYENKGMMEGVRYGLYIGIWMSMGMAFGTYAMIEISLSLAIQWFIYGIIEYVIAGAALTVVYKK